jgi:hypothetical protein
MAETLSAIVSRALALAALLVSAAVPASAEAARSEVGAPPDPAPIVQPGSGDPAPDAAIAGPSTATAADPMPGSSTTLVHSGTRPAPGCDAQSIVVNSRLAGATDADCVSPDLERDQAYLVETASPGGTMLRQGPALAIARLHPMFVRRLAGAIREAREGGLPSTGIFSAYRPPAFGVGGFSDKFNSLHTYGLAVDMLGIGGPGSSEAKRWHDIAGLHGIICPYGADNRREWNHCQPTRVKIIVAGNALRGTVSPQGPVDLDAMFAVGNALVNETDAGAGPPELKLTRDQKGFSRPQGRLHGAASRAESTETDHDTANRTHTRHALLKTIARLVARRYLHEADGHPNLRIMRETSARHNPQAAPSWCRHVHNPRRDLCRLVADNASGKSGPVKKYRTSSLVRREIRVH